MAVFFLCRQRIKPNGELDGRLFTDDTTDSFSELMRTVVHDQEIIPPGVDLGAVRTELGTHSNRKGCATYLLALSTSLSVVCVYLRAGWTLGRVQDRYILGGPGGDQLIARAGG